MKVTWAYLPWHFETHFRIPLDGVIEIYFIKFLPAVNVELWVEKKEESYGIFGVIVPLIFGTFESDFSNLLIFQKIQMREFKKFKLSKNSNLQNFQIFKKRPANFQKTSNLWAQLLI